MVYIAQEMLRVAPYYLLDTNASVADILTFDPASAEIFGADAAQGDFRSSTTDTSALMTLVVHYQLADRCYQPCVTGSLRPNGLFAALTMA